MDSSNDMDPEKMETESAGSDQIDRLPSRLGSNGGEDSRSGEASNGAVLDQQSERVPYRLQSKVGEDSRSTEASNGIGQQSDAVPSLPGTQEGEDSRSKEASNQTDSDAQQSLRLPSLPVGTQDANNGTTDANEESSSQTQAQPIAVVVAVPDPTTVKVDSVKKWLASFSASSSIGTMSSSSSPGASSSPAPLPRRGNLRNLPKRSYDEKDDDDDKDSGDDEYDVANDDPQAKKRRKEMEREAKKLQKEAKKKEKELQRKMRRQAELQRRQDRREEKEMMAEAAAFQKRIEDDMREAEAIRKEEAEKLWRKQKIEDDFRKERKRASKRFSTELKSRAPQEEKPREHRSHSVDWLGESSPSSPKANNNGYFQLLEEMRKKMKKQFGNSVEFMQRSGKMDNGYYFKSIQDPFFRAAKMRQAETAPRNIFSSFDDEIKIRPDDALLMFPQWNEKEQNKLDTCFGRFPTRGLHRDFGKLLGIEPMSQTVARIGIHTVDRVTNPDARARYLEAFADKAALLLKSWKPEDPEEEMPRTGHYFLYVYKKVVKAGNWITSGQMDFVRDLLFWLPVHLADLIGPLHVPRPSLHAICRQLFALLLDEWTVSMKEVLEEELQSLYRLQFASWRLECSMLQSAAPVVDMLPHWKPAKRPEGLFGHPEGPLETEKKRKSMELWKAKKGCRFNRRYSRRIEIQNNRKEEMILEEQPRRQAPRGRWQSCPPAIDSTRIQKRQRSEEERVRIPQNLLPDYWGGSF